MQEGHTIDRAKHFLTSKKLHSSVLAAFYGTPIEIEL